MWPYSLPSSKELMGVILGFAMLCQALQIPFNGLINICLSFDSGLSLRKTAGQGRTIGYEDPVLILFNYNSEFPLDTSYRVAIKK
jgi:hypothetical protein